MSYALQPGERLNGGYSVTIGDYTLRSIGAYKVTWVCVYDTANIYTDYLGNEVKPLLGRRFSLDISTGALTAADMESLAAELKADTISVSCPDFTGDCYCDNIPAELNQANFCGTRYKLNFTLTAKALTSVGSL